MGAVQKLATTVIVGLVALATVLVVLLANEPNRRDQEEEEQQEVAIERAIHTYILNCVACHGPGGEGITTPGEQGTGRIGLPLGGNTEGGQRAQALNQSQDPTVRQEREDIIRDALNYGRGQMPAWGIEGDNRLNQEQIDELVLMIQNVDWDRVYNEAIHEFAGYPTPQPAPVAAAAGTGQQARGEEDIGSGDVSPTGSPMASPVAGSPTAEQGPAAGGAEPQTVTAVGIAWDKTELTIPANTDVPFSLVNQDPLYHNFTVEGTNTAVDMPASQTVNAVVNLPAGTYTYVCTVPGHEALMVGTLTVQ